MSCKLKDASVLEAIDEFGCSDRDEFGYINIGESFNYWSCLEILLKHGDILLV